jgi:hypothetical protein
MLIKQLDDFEQPFRTFDTFVSFHSATISDLDRQIPSPS